MAAQRKSMAQGRQRPVKQRTPNPTFGEIYAEKKAKADAKPRKPRSKFWGAFWDVFDRSDNWR